MGADKSTVLAHMLGMVAGVHDVVAIDVLRPCLVLDLMQAEHTFDPLK